MLGLLWKYIREHSWLYISIALVLLVYDFTVLVPTQVIQRLVDSLTSQNLTEAGFIRDLLLLVGATVINYLSAYYWHLKLFQSSVNFKTRMQKQAFEKLVAMRTPFYEKFRSGDILTRFSTDVEGMMEMVGYGVMIILYGGGLIAFIIPAMFWISWQISLLAMIPLVFLLLSTYYLGKKQDVFVEQNREAVASLNDEVLEMIEGVRVSRAYGKKAHQALQFQKRTRDLAQAGDRIAAIQYLYGPLANIFIGISTLLILLVGAVFVGNGQMTIGQVIALQLYMLSLIEPMWMMADFILVYQTGKTSFKKVTELIETGDDLETDGQKELKQIECIEFKDYSFAYPQVERESLHRINWHILAGQTLGIVGKTGSGKTSLVRQFLRQYPLGSGDFLINDLPVTAYKRNSIEEKIGYVPQEHILFSKSVAENISLGKAGASQEEIKAAIETAAFTEDLQGMPDGLQTMIGERGVSISGGQKQRISIARAFLRNPDLLILDDSLSAVDARTEQRIIANIQRERAGKTNIIVSHRLSAVHQADWILVLDQGRIIEEGRSEDLLIQKGWYYEQYQRQQSQKGEDA